MTTSGPHFFDMSDLARFVEERPSQGARMRGGETVESMETINDDEDLVLETSHI